MIDFQEFKRNYINWNLPKLYAGELDVTIIELVGNVNFAEMKEFNGAARDMYVSCQWSKMDVSCQWRNMDSLLEKLAIEYLSDAAKHEYKNMIAAAEDEAGAERAFYNLNR